MNQDNEIIHQLQQRNREAFKALCCEHAEEMSILAYILLEDSNRANQVVIDILLRLWSEDRFKEATAPLHKFLYHEVRKECEILTWNMQTS